MHRSWSWRGARTKRPMNSVILEPAIADSVLEDCVTFLNSKTWYASKGIPYRRGYLLHGVPGSGKTSLIHALASQLGLDIYIVNLASKGMSDEVLANLMGAMPQHCIALFEDIDAAFTRSLCRDVDPTGAPTTSSTTTGMASVFIAPADESRVTLNGLLNNLDGFTATEGRLLFATTNHIEFLDPALRRPGRMDVLVHFKHSTKWQAAEIYKRFFSSSPAHPSRSLPSEIESSVLDDSELDQLAQRFAGTIPEHEMTSADILGYLLKNKTRPKMCVDEAHEWYVLTAFNVCPFLITHVGFVPTARKQNVSRSREKR
ncbi:P-loop containing nucleoside triphosphate hydrolase protein [Stereum hirsutum FP-91666 SS1]|uniref:P-loop containing nucleoside triphosphate hydrolase protein n=1 Tax=Stereum hirsutum (strain FP-91666) TaxID=721885 RepID=UPI000444A85A|nr:P-loop containing nucleoside triphosphate hydrolase protein [Stereum hirsutum FP-91666 SS1]EIM83650.1 P-loop containing nucleoside triphosphate hydrolase protein [Stereum hirsutum FP-91666 SS1]